MKKIIIVLALMAGLWGVVLPVAQAANIVDVNFPCPGGNIPGFPDCERIPDGEINNDFVGYVLQAYQFGIGIVGIIAVGMIVYGGILIAWNTESIDKKGKGREMITSALTGIAVLFGSYLLLKTINPELVKFNLTTNIPTQCSDKKDNDKDGEIDYPKDTDCTSEEDATERASSGTIKEALSSLKTMCGENGDPAKISRPSKGNEASSDPTCEYRKLNYKGPAFKVGTDSDYYGEWSPDDINSNYTIWSYPYFIKDKGTSTAKCLIYAYKEPGDEADIVKIDLDDDLAICSLNPEIKQKNSGDLITGQNAASAIIENELAKSGVSISSSGNCNYTDNPSCTSLEGLPQQSIDLLKRIGVLCKQNFGYAGMEDCAPVITGGTEIGHQTHGIGKNAFDLRSSGPGTEKLAKILKNLGVKKLCTTADQSQYRINCNSFDEAVGHFHVEL